MVFKILAIIFTLQIERRLTQALLSLVAAGGRHVAVVVKEVLGPDAAAVAVARRLLEHIGVRMPGNRFLRKTDRVCLLVNSRFSKGQDRFFDSLKRGYEL